MKYLSTVLLLFAVSTQVSTQMSIEPEIPHSLVRVSVGDISYIHGGMVMALVEYGITPSPDSSIVMVGIERCSAAAMYAAMRGESISITPPIDSVTSVIDALGASITDVVVSSSDEANLYAEVHVIDAEGVLRAISIRTVDAIQVSVFTGCPLFIRDDVWSKEAKPISQWIPAQPSDQEL